MCELIHEDPKDGITYANPATLRIVLHAEDKRWIVSTILIPDITNICNLKSLLEGGLILAFFIIFILLNRVEDK